MLQEPAESPYDVRFFLFGFPVRISWSFWLGALVIGHPLVRLVDDLLIQNTGDSPGMGPLIVLWTFALFLSILIHELGHALAFRQQGIQSSIVLYHFGGLAVPIASLIPGRSIGRLTAKQDLWVTFAGPLLQVLAAALAIGAIKLAGNQVTAFGFMPAGLHKLPGMLEGEPIESGALYGLAFFFVYPSIVWALLNLLPVLPLDGGRIMRSIILLTGGDESQSLWISVVTAGLLAAYALTHEQTFMGIFFAMFAVQSFQMLQQKGGRRY
ncbi:MAG: site-2 protease family protein [Pirellulaceae bacterium]